MELCFLGPGFWVPILVDRDEICSGYGPAKQLLGNIEALFLHNDRKRK